MLASLNPRAPWHIVQRKANVAPLPIDLSAGALQHLGDDCDARRRVIGSDDLHPGWCVANEFGGTTDRVPKPMETLARLGERQPGEADDGSDNCDRGGDRDACGEPRIAQGRNPFPAHWRSPTLTAGTAVPGVARRCAIGKP